MSSIFVRPTTLLELPAACRLLAQYRPPGRREVQTGAYLAPLTNGTIDPAGLLVAITPSGAVSGAILSQVLDGAMGIVWPPGVEAQADLTVIEDALVSAACGWLAGARVKVAQWLPPSGDRDGVEPLERHGFTLVTQLSLWERELGSSVSVTNPQSSLSFIPAGEAADFASTILATYEGSRDCPESAGGRTPKELIAGHGTPSAEESLWFVVRQESETLGVVLLARTQVRPRGELSYLGLVPTARRRGFGHELVRFALARSVAVGFHNLSLSVDVRNEPALQLYRAHGFRPYEWRDIYHRVLGVDGNLF